MSSQVSPDSISLFLHLEQLEVEETKLTDAAVIRLLESTKLATKDASPAVAVVEVTVL